MTLRRIVGEVLNNEGSNTSGRVRRAAEKSAGGVVGGGDSSVLTAFL